MIQVIKVNESLYVENVIAATIASMLDGLDCYVHVTMDGSISWSKYVEGEMLARRQLHVKCTGPLGAIYEASAVSTRPEDLRALILGKPDLYIIPMQNELYNQASNSTARIDWIV